MMGISKAWIGSAVGACILAAAGLFVYLVMARRPGRVDLAVHRGDYESIVAAVKARQIKEGSSASLRVDGFDPSTLRPDENKAVALDSGIVNVLRRPGGDYVIEIITYDRVHSGFGGYLFHDKAIGAQDKIDLAPYEAEHRFHRLDAHWHAFDNNSV